MRINPPGTAYQTLFLFIKYIDILVFAKSGGPTDQTVTINHE